MNLYHEMSCMLHQMIQKPENYATFKTLTSAFGSVCNEFEISVWLAAVPCSPISNEGNEEVSGGETSLEKEIIKSQTKNTAIKNDKHIIHFHICTLKFIIEHQVG